MHVNLYAIPSLAAATPQHYPLTADYELLGRHLLCHEHADIVKVRFQKISDVLWCSEEGKLNLIVLRTARNLCVSTAAAKDGTITYGAGQVSLPVMSWIANRGYPQLVLHERHDVTYMSLQTTRELHQFGCVHWLLNRHGEDKRVGEDEGHPLTE